jgi:hypothetical protein
MKHDQKQQKQQKQKQQMGAFRQAAPPRRQDRQNEGSRGMSRRRQSG